MWQTEWDKEKRDRHLYNVQRDISRSKTSYINRQEEVWFSRMRIGHTGLNSSLLVINKHPSGTCKCCGVRENVEHVMLRCGGFSRQREKLGQEISLVP